MARKHRHGQSGGNAKRDGDLSRDPCLSHRVLKNSQHV